MGDVVSEPASVVYVTAGSRDAAVRLGRLLVEERLAACANVFDGATSVYRWEGNVEEATEAVLVLKTRTALVEEVLSRVVALHDYDCPCATSWPIATGHSAYLEWITEQTR